MGFLSEILGGLANNAFGGRGDTRTGGGARSPLLMALLPIVLSMLSQRGRNSSGAAASASAGGFGGLGDLLERFTQRGYGPQAASWVGTGENKPLPPEAIDEVFDTQELQQMANQAGVSRDDVRSGLSELLPDVIDHVTPGGAVPEADSLSASVDDYLRRLS